MLKAKNEQFREYVQYKVDRNRFMEHIGFKITKIEPGVIEGELEIGQEHEQQNGYVHGGVTSSLCDMAAGFASYSLVAEGDQVFTVEIKISYYNPGIGQKLRVKGYVTKPGKRFHFCESEVFVINNGEEKIIARSSTTMAVIEKGEFKSKK